MLNVASLLTKRILWGLKGTGTEMENVAVFICKACKVYLYVDKADI